MKKSSPTLTSLALGALLLALSGCDRSLDFVADAAGHAISARIKGPHSVEAEADRAVIASSHGKVTIERARVSLSEGQWTAIPEGVPVVLEMVQSKVQIKAGNVTITQTVR